jgi:hypothetical protein
MANNRSSHNICKISFSSRNISWNGQIQSRCGHRRLVDILKRVRGKAQLGPSRELEGDAQSPFDDLLVVSSEGRFPAPQSSARTRSCSFLQEMIRLSNKSPDVFNCTQNGRR